MGVLVNESHKGKCGTVLHILYAVAPKLSWNSLVYFTGIDTLNKDMYSTFTSFVDFVYASGRKRPEEWRTNSWFLRRDNAPAHRPLLVKDFLEKNKDTTQEHSPYSPCLATADFTCSCD